MSSNYSPWARYEEESLFAEEVAEVEEPLNLWTRKDIDAPTAKKSRSDPESSILHSLLTYFSLHLLLFLLLYIFFESLFKFDIFFF